MMQLETTAEARGMRRDATAGFSLNPMSMRSSASVLRAVSAPLCGSADAHRQGWIADQSVSGARLDDRDRVNADAPSAAIGGP